MKKLLGILVLGLLWCNVGFATIKTLSDKLEALLKNNITCVDGVKDLKWKFKFTKIDKKNYYVEADGLADIDPIFEKKIYAEWSDGHRLKWFSTAVYDDHDSKVLFYNSLSLRKNTKNYVRFMIFFDELSVGLNDGDFNRLHKKFLKTNKPKNFYDATHNFIFNSDGSAAIDKKNFVTHLFADCDTGRKSILDVKVKKKKK